MSPEVSLAAIIIVPVIVLMIMRINAVLVFLSLCLGDVLVQFVSGDTKSFISLFTTNNPKVVNASMSDIKITLLLLPVVLTAVFMIRTVKGRTKLMMNALPAVGVGLLGALLIVPQLSPGLRFSITGSSLWQQVERAEDLIVGISALICLFVLWLQRPKTGGGEGKHHGKHHKG
jgi:hypothetical protein